MQHHLDCSITATKTGDARSWPSSTHTPPSSSTSEPRMPPLNVRIDVARAYFNYVHNPCHLLFHETTFMTEVANDEVSQDILFAIIAIAARFSSDSFFERIEPRARGEPYIRESQKLLDVHDISLPTLRLAVLLGAYWGADGDSTHENLYYTIACRIAGLLNVPNLDYSALSTRDTEIRLYWTLHLIDLWSNTAVSQPKTFYNRGEVPLPLSEGTPLNARRGSDISILSQSQISASEELHASIFAEKVKLNLIFADIAALTTASAHKTAPGHELHNTTEKLAERLMNWRRQLSPWLVDTQENLAYHASKGTGGSFVSMYLGYYHFAQLLFYRYLHFPNVLDDSIGPDSSILYSYSERCRLNSTALCGTIYNAYATPGAEVYYSTVGHILVVASTVQLHILLFSDNDGDISAARRRLERNFQILCKLQKFWRVLDICLGRFRAFHDACMKSKLNKEGIESPFRLDKWMVGFMMEFSKQVEDRPEEKYTVVQDQSPLDYEQMLNDEEISMAFDLHQWSIDAVGIDFELPE